MATGERHAGREDLVQAAVDAIRLAARWHPAAHPSSATAQAETLRAAALATDVQERYADSPRSVEAAADLVLVDLAATLRTRGWPAADLWQVTHRKLDGLAESLLVDTIAAECARRPAAAVSARTREQLTRLGAVVWWERDRPHLGQWAHRHGLSGPDAVGVVLRVAGLGGRLPALPVPAPDSPDRSGVDERMLAKVRALLAKAESTQFPEEAEMLSAKAQELMSRYSVERALVDDQGSGAAAGARGSVRRVWLDSPYLGPKAHLVAAVARANRCRAVSYERLEFAVLVGHEVDLDIAELLATSLLVQATEAMLLAGRDAGRAGQSRLRSFRHAFLLAYAARIGERLREADRVSTEQVRDERLLPVLARREQEVERLFTDLFPRTVARRTTASNPEGWGAGRAAADAADLGVRRAQLSVFR
ncbi:Protein of unknown function [Amycolatopsis marina]|uniref:Uncharacterized protein n=1 Tax=Amycolatopsis marina TaxID=490629 RepID=A0A1I1BA69_9PSEU|nr:DUF2786 domain-containing protein [Amycolatopsis marina]SFB45423.1 Protein of unknown function [Amycolatopsis marina]